MFERTCSNMVVITAQTKTLIFICPPALAKKLPPKMQDNAKGSVLNLNDVIQSFTVAKIIYFCKALDSENRHYTFSFDDTL